MARAATTKARTGKRPTASKAKARTGSKPKPSTPPSTALPRDAAALAQMINDYAIQTQPGNSKVIMKHASVVSKLRDVTMRGVLIHKQLTHIGANGQRSYDPPQGTPYSVQANDGDIHFCLGTKENAEHVPCELQHGHNYLATINGAIGKPIVVSGFFRCLFEHPGLNRTQDAHIFEIHPVRAIDIGNGTLTFDVAKPDAPSIHPWTPSVNTADRAVKVTYDTASDSLTFEHVKGMDMNYVAVSGTVQNIDLKPNSSEPSQFRFTSPDISAGAVDVFCLKGTAAAAQLELLKDGGRVDLTGLRNIDVAWAMRNKYVINLLGIDIQSKPQAVNVFRNETFYAAGTGPS